MARSVLLLGYLLSHWLATIARPRDSKALRLAALDAVDTLVHLLLLSRPLPWVDAALVALNDAGAATELLDAPVTLWSTSDSDAAAAGSAGTADALLPALAAGRRMLASYLPGLVSHLYRVLTRDQRAGSRVLIGCGRVLTRVVIACCTGDAVDEWLAQQQRQRQSERTALEEERRALEQQQPPSTQAVLQTSQQPAHSVEARLEQLQQLVLASTAASQRANSQQLQEQQQQQQRPPLYDGDAAAASRLQQLHQPQFL